MGCSLLDGLWLNESGRGDACTVWSHAVQGCSSYLYCHIHTRICKARDSQDFRTVEYFGLRKLQVTMKCSEMARREILVLRMGRRAE